MKNLTADKDELIDVLGKQKIIIDELILREPEKVKKLKQQKNSLAAKQDDLNAEMKSLKMSSDKMKRVMEEKAEEVECLMRELKMARADCDEKAHVNAALTEEISILQKILKEKKEEEVVNEEKFQFAENQVNKLQKNISILKFSSSEKDSTILKLEEDLKIMKRSHVMKDDELVNLKKKIEVLARQVAFSVVQIATKYAVDTEQFELEITELRKKNIKQSDEMESLKLINAEINDKVTLLNEHVKKYETARKLNEERLKEAEKEVEYKLVQLKDIVNANKELLNVNKTLNEEIKLQDERIINMEEKMRDIMKFCSIERKRNEDILDGMRLVQFKMKVMEDSIVDEQRMKKSTLRRLISRFQCSGSSNR